MIIDITALPLAVTYIIIIIIIILLSNSDIAISSRLFCRGLYQMSLLRRRYSADGVDTTPCRIEFIINTSYDLFVYPSIYLVCVATFILYYIAALNNQLWHTIDHFLQFTLGHFNHLPFYLLSCGCWWFWCCGCRCRCWFRCCGCWFLLLFLPLFIPI